MPETSIVPTLMVLIIIYILLRDTEKNLIIKQLNLQHYINKLC